jgi:exodeoxyribonuclease V alpha subunit
MPINPEHLATRVACFFAKGDKPWQMIVNRLLDALKVGHICIGLSEEELSCIAQRSDVYHAGTDKEADWSQVTQPFVLDKGHLYWQRYWQHEVEVETQLLALSTHQHILSMPLEPFFDDKYQQDAAKMALSKQLTVITGGPGTGKTTTIVKILALLLLHAPGLIIKVAAPTGKAAARLSESLRNGKQNTQFVRSCFVGQEQALDAVPENATTLHSLLKTIHGSPEFRHNKDNPLQADVVVVDEASMVDIGMFNRLLKALPTQCKLILMGDADQLASVEAGAVLSSIAEGLSEHRVHLQNTYRFGGAIKALAVAVNEQQKEDFKAVLHSEDVSVSLQPEPAIDFVKNQYLIYAHKVKAFSDGANIAELFEMFAQFQVLTATRSDKEQFDSLGSQLGLAQTEQNWYHGRPVMITQNQPDIGLFNGDIGIVLATSVEGNQQELRVYFPSSDGFQSLLPAQLPAHETAFAMTIHKSQGSEFGHVCLVMPDKNVLQSSQDPLGQLLCKELLYTGITRAKEKVTLVGDPSVFAFAIDHNTQRNSLLTQRLL